MQGRMDYDNGDVYVGGFNDDSREGKGKFISCETGVTLEGIWLDDEFQGPS